MSERMTHEMAYDLLPWHATGTLTAEESGRVEEHVRTCLTCRLEFAKERELYELVQRSPSADIAAEDGFERLSRRLDDSLRSRRRMHTELIEPFTHGWRAAAWRPGVPLAACAAAVALLVWQTSPRLTATTEPGYVTLAGPPIAADAALDIVFAERVTELELRGLITEIGGSIVTGPTAVGRYRVRLDDPRTDDIAMAELIRTLNGDQRVRFAGRAVTAEDPSR